MKRQFILIAAVLITALAGVFAYATHLPGHIANVPSAPTQAVSASTSPVRHAENGPAPVPQKTTLSIQKVAESMPLSSGPTATFAVGSTTYAVAATPNETVIDAMKSLASTSAFTYSGSDYPSLGIFIESINGKKNANGYYWILYINGVSSSEGASMATIKPGDTVEWRYERGN